MKVQGQVNADVEDTENRGVPKEAVLVRRGREDGSAGAFGRGGQGAGWLARRDASGSSVGAGGGGGAGLTMGVKGVSEGVGVDARRWVEGLLSLNR